MSDNTILWVLGIIGVIIIAVLFIWNGAHDENVTIEPKQSKPPIIGLPETPNGS